MQDPARIGNISRQAHPAATRSLTANSNATGVKANTTVTRASAVLGRLVGVNAIACPIGITITMLSAAGDNAIAVQAKTITVDGGSGVYTSACTIPAHFTVGIGDLAT